MMFKGNSNTLYFTVWCGCVYVHTMQHTIGMINVRSSVLTHLLGWAHMGSVQSKGIFNRHTNRYTDTATACWVARLPLWEEEMQQGGGCHRRQSKPSFVLIHRSGRRGHSICARATGVAGGWLHPYYPISKQLQYPRCKVVSRLDSNVMWIPAGVKPLVMRLSQRPDCLLPVSSRHKEPSWHTSAASCCPQRPTHMSPRTIQHAVALY